MQLHRYCKYYITLVLGGLRYSFLVSNIKAGPSPSYWQPSSQDSCALRLQLHLHHSSPHIGNRKVDMHAACRRCDVWHTVGSQGNSSSGTEKLRGRWTSGTRIHGSCKSVMLPLFAPHAMLEAGQKAVVMVVTVRESNMIHSGNSRFMHNPPSSHAHYPKRVGKPMPHASCLMPPPRGRRRRRTTACTVGDSGRVKALIKRYKRPELCCLIVRLRCWLHRHRHRTFTAIDF